MASELATAAKVKIGRREWPFIGLAETSAMYRTAIERLGIGASKTPQCLIVDGNDAVLAYVSYNGRVWAGSPLDWQPGVMPLFCNRPDAPLV